MNDKHPPTPPTLDEEQLRRAINELKAYFNRAEHDWQAWFRKDIELVAAAASRVADYQPGLKALLEENEELRVQRDDARRDERQHWTDFERKALECIALKQERDQLLARVKELEEKVKTV